MKFAIVLVVVVIAAITTQAVQPTYSQLSKETVASILINGPPVNLTADQEDLDIAIDATDPLPANGTVTITTFGATDTDINGFPPVGVSVIIQNDTVTVTNQTVTIGNTFAAAEALESNDDDDGDGDGGDGEDGE